MEAFKKLVRYKGYETEMFVLFNKDSDQFIIRSKHQGAQIKMVTLGEDNLEDEIMELHSDFMDCIDKGLLGDEFKIPESDNVPKLFQQILKDNGFEINFD